MVGSLDGNYVDVDFVSAAVPKTDFARDLQMQAASLEAADSSGTDFQFSSGGGSMVHMLNPYHLKIKKDWSGRDHEDSANVEHVRKLAVSITARGVVQPITVHVEKDGLYITDGHCRYLAVMNAINQLGAPIQSVPVCLERH